ncbi:MAG: hypothetical protein HFE49_07070 [Clostridia bacterium]|nr:hypothetical protein [Clostridia bacterium]
MYKTYSYNDMPKPVIRHKEEPVKPAPPPPPPQPPKCQEKHDGILGGLLDNIASDDLILIIVAFVLLADDCDDKLLLIAIAFIFFADKF